MGSEAARLLADFWSSFPFKWAKLWNLMWFIRLEVLDVEYILSFVLVQTSGKGPTCRR
jgi:hypothetical protein